MTQDERLQALKEIESLLNKIESLASKPIRMSSDRILNCVSFAREKLELIQNAAKAEEQEVQA